MTTATQSQSQPQAPQADPVWRILTGFGVFSLGVFLCGSVLTYNPQDPSWNTATDLSVTNLFSTPGAVVSDVLFQLLGAGAILLSFLLFAAGIKRMLLIGLTDSGKWFLGLLGTLAAATCLSSWVIPESWTLSVSLGGLLGDGLFALAQLPLKALQIPFATEATGVLMGIASFFLLTRAANLGNHDLTMILRLFGNGVKRLLFFVLLPLGPLGRGLGKGLVGGIMALRRQMAGLIQRKPKAAAYTSASDAAPNDDVFGYYEHTVDAGNEPKDNVKDEAKPNQSSFFFADDEPKPNKAKQKPAEKKKPTKRKPLVDGSSLPSLDLLVEPPTRSSGIDEAQLLARAEHLMKILNEFGVKGQITHVRPGPVVTLFELEPAPGVKSSRVIALADDVARSMSAISARIAVVPGKNAIGIELPNKSRETVYFRSLLESIAFSDTKQALPLALGEDIGGQPVCADLAKMPHLLIAGTTGSGKSVGINAMILSLMYKLPPEKCRFIMIDPKMLELSIYEGIPHLLSPVVIDPKKAVSALKWAVREMESRYELMSKTGVRNMAGFNEKVGEMRARGERLTREVQTGFEADTGRPIFETQEIPLDAMPNIVIVIDEMADLMMVAGKEIEACIQRLAQMARAAGIHLITATQRPSVDVITGTIKANFPTRISYMVSSKIDSRTILNEQGAEQLLGMGDLLYMASGGKVKRLHGPFVSDEEVGDIVEFLKSTGEPDYQTDITEEPEDAPDSPVMDAMIGSDGGGSDNDLYAQAVAIVLRDGRASTSYVQRRLKIGYNRAASIIEQMEDEGVISAPNHAGKREILKKHEDAE